MSAISTRSAKTADMASRGLRAARRPRTAAGRCLNRDEAPVGAAGGAAAGSAGVGVSGCGGAGGAAVPASASDMPGPGGAGIGSDSGRGLATGRIGAGEPGTGMDGAGMDGAGMDAGVAVSHGAVSHGAERACDDRGDGGGPGCCACGGGACCACGTGWPSGGGASGTCCIDCGCWVA